MNWFYAQDGRQMGPVDEGELDGLVRRGEIIASTLVWRSGLENWRPYAEVRPTHGPVAAAERTAATLPDRPGEARCAECAEVFPEEEVVRLAGAALCARCKPVYLQRLREGAPLPNRLPFAGFWIRLCATFFDSLILLPLQLAVWGCLITFYPDTAMVEGPFGAMRLSLQLFFYLIFAVYETAFVGRFGATPGKMICDLRVVRADGAKLTYGRALGRHFAKYLSGLTLGIGYLIAAFDDQKRALEDHVCDTRVIYK